MLKCFISLIVFCVSCSSLWGAVVEVNIHPQSKVKQSRIILGDIAEIKVLAPSADDLAEQIKNIDLGPSPAAGESTVMSRAELEQKVTKARLILSDTMWYIPQQITINYAHTSPGEINSEEIRKTVLDYLSRAEPYRSGKFELISFNMAHPPRLPDGDLQYRFTLQASSNPSNISGYINFVVDGRTAGRSRVTAQVDLEIESLVALRPLSRGHIIKEGDVGINLIPYAQAKEALSDPALAVGNTLKVNVDAGEPIKDRQLTKSILIRRGDVVTIVAKQGGLIVSASGQAKQDGAMGDTITVVNLSSNKTLAARVIGPNQVEIIF